MKIKDKTVLKTLGFCSFGMGANVAAVDIKDGKIARIRPLHYDEQYTREDLNAWKFEVRGHTFDPRMQSLTPPFSLAYKKRTYSPNRIPYPLKRIDWNPEGDRNPQNRGISGYERISWDEATDIIAKEIKRIHDEYDVLSIFCQGEGGHGETQTVHGPHGCQTRMFEKMDLGQSEFTGELDNTASIYGNEQSGFAGSGMYTQQARNSDSWEGWYWGAKHVWGMDTIGQSIFTNNVIKDISENGDAILFWGCDPETTPWGWSGQQASRLCFWFSEVGVKSIHIAPDANYANIVHADRWIPVLPNTDAALHLGIAYTWITEGTYEKDYLKTHAVGYEKWFDYVLGKTDGIPKDSQWAAEKCGVPSYRIKALARYWASHKVSIAHCNGGGMVRSCFAHEPARMEVYLLAMQGVGDTGKHQFKFIEWTLYGNPGANPLPRCEVIPNCFAGYRGGWCEPTSDSLIPKTMVPRCLKWEEGDEPIRFMSKLFPCMLRVDQFNEYRWPLEGHGAIHMIWTDLPSWTTCWNCGNEFVDAVRHKNIEFFLAQHPWMENDCLYADIVLPTSTMMEVTDIGHDSMSGQWTLVYCEDQAIEPIGEAMSDYEAVGEIAKKLEKFGGIYEDLYTKYTDGLTVEQHRKLAFEHSGLGYVCTFEEFKDRQFVMSRTMDGWENDPIGMRAFFDDPEANPLETPTGKIEFWSQLLADNFPDDEIRGPMAKWIEEGDGHKERKSSDRAAMYPFLLVSNHPRWRVHSEHEDIPWTREIESFKVKGPDGYLYEPLYINPIDAEAYGLKDGDVAKIYNERGGVLGGVKISERIMPGCLSQDHGARLDGIVTGIGGLDRGGANNLICPSSTTSKNAPGEVTNNFLVGLEKVDVFELARQYPEAFGRDYDAGAGVTVAGYLVS